MNSTFDSGSRPTSGNGPGQKDPLRRMLLRSVEHSLWANRQWVDFVYALPDPESRPRELLAHLMVGERVWFERIAGQQISTTMFPLMEKDALLRGFAENAETFRGLIGSDLNVVVQFRRGTGEEYQARVEDIIHHLLTHGYHHRGQLAALYARSGVQYPNTDHINFLIENEL